MRLELIGKAHPLEEMMGNYYLIRLNEDGDGLEVREFSREKLDDFFEKEDLNEYFGPSYFCDKFPKANEWSGDKLVLIRGDVIVPEKVEVVTTWRL